MTGKDNTPLAQRIPELRAEYDQAMLRLDSLAAAWLRTRAGGLDRAELEVISAEIRAADRESRKLERKLHKAQKDAA